MRIFPFMQVDAFTSTPLHGNPCAVILDADPLTGDEMQAIAREQNLSETAFVLHSDVADVRARYFTPLSEIPLAGHPTIATIHALVESNRLDAQPPKSTIQLELQAGVIPVDIENRGDTGQQIVMTQLQPVFSPPVAAEDVCMAFGIHTADLHPGLPVQVVSTGTPQLMVCVQDTSALRNLALQYDRLAALGQKIGFFSAHLFCVGHDGCSTFARHFAPEFEDPFTGSATGAMGAFLWRYELIATPTFTAHQGDWMHRPGRAQVEIIGPPRHIESVKVGGQAVTVIQGELTLPR